MLPNSDHSPTPPFQHVCLSSISPNIVAKFREPEGLSNLWPRVVLRASVPKAPVDEDGHLGPRKDDIRPTAPARELNSITQALMLLLAEQIAPG